MDELVEVKIVEETIFVEVDITAAGPGGEDGDPSAPWPVTDLGDLGATLVMDMLGKGKATFAAVTTATALAISIPNPPADGLEGEATIMLTTTTIPASITFPSGTVDAPTITEGKVWELSFKTIDGGVTWRVIGKEWTS